MSGERAYEVLETVQENLNEIDRRYKRLQRMLMVRYASIAIVVLGVAIGGWWLLS